MKKDNLTILGDYVLFWRGWPSQWYPSAFNIGGIDYNCTEQFMMSEKARLFGDNKALGQILNTRSPKEHKEWGRRVKGFDKDLWNNVAKEIVFLGNLAKFTQNKDLMEQLIATENRILVEASPYDTVWGIGLSETDPDATDPKKWKGTNWLGEVLMKVRDVLTYKPNC